jgi:Tropinone reductase 1
MGCADYLGCLLQPWYVATPLTVPVLADKEVLAALEGRTPMRRVGQPEEISGDHLHTY